MNRYATLLGEFTKACRAVGDDMTLVQGGGGNVSLKDRERPDYMLIKASGGQLRAVSSQDGFTPVNWVAVSRYMEKLPATVRWTPQGEKRYLDALRGAKMGKEMPSLETGFHAFLSDAVVHTHPMATNVFLCTYDGPALLRQTFPDAVFIPYATVGYVLSKAILNARPRKEDGRPIFLENHGLITHARTLEEAVQQTKDVVDRCSMLLAKCRMPLPEPLEERSDHVRTLLNEVTLEEFDGLQETLTVHPFPDSVIYAPEGYVAVTEDLRYLERGRVGLHSDGSIDASSCKKPAYAAEVAHAVAYLVLAGKRLGGIRQLPDKEVYTLTRMQSEKYRQR